MIGKGSAAILVLLAASAASSSSMVMPVYQEVRLRFQETGSAILRCKEDRCQVIVSIAGEHCVLQSGFVPDGLRPVPDYFRIFSAQERFDIDLFSVELSVRCPQQRGGQQCILNVLVQNCEVSAEKELYMRVFSDIDMEGQ